MDGVKEDEKLVGVREDDQRGRFDGGRWLASVAPDGKSGMEKKKWSVSRDNWDVKERQQFYINTVKKSFKCRSLR